MGLSQSVVVVGVGDRGEGAGFVVVVLVRLLVDEQVLARGEVTVVWPQKSV